MLNEKMRNKNYAIAPNVALIKGHTRSMAFDLERSSYQLIPNILATMLEDDNCKTIDEVLQKYAQGNAENEATILEYFRVLIKHDFIFFSEFTNYYKKINYRWDYDGVISNAILDLSNESNYSVKKVLIELAQLGCRSVQIRAFRPMGYSEVNEIMSHINNSLIESLHFIIPYTDEDEINALIDSVKTFSRIRLIQVYNSPEDSLQYINQRKTTSIVKIKSDLKNEKSCGIVSPTYFSVAFYTFTESQHHNTCLNRKISIDKKGDIKNCPSIPKAYGNVENTSLKEALDHPEFKKYWNINKDKIHVCKDCEFRHICTDCRAYVEDPEDIYSKPLKCGYNPYEGTWSEWSTNPLKQKAMQHYDMQVLMKQDS